MGKLGCILIAKSSFLGFFSDVDALVLVIIEVLKIFERLDRVDVLLTLLRNLKSINYFSSRFWNFRPKLHADNGSYMRLRPGIDLPDEPS